MFVKRNFTGFIQVKKYKTYKMNTDNMKSPLEKSKEYLNKAYEFQMKGQFEEAILNYKLSIDFFLQLKRIHFSAGHTVLPVILIKRLKNARMLFQLMQIMEIRIMT